MILLTVAIEGSLDQCWLTEVEFADRHDRMGSVFTFAAENLHNRNGPEPAMKPQGSSYACSASNSAATSGFIMSTPSRIAYTLQAIFYESSPVGPIGVAQAAALLRLSD